MAAIQIILVLLLALAGTMALFVLKKQLAVRLFFLAQLALGIVFVLWPDLTSRLATRLGVGRGTDLMLYLLIVLVYFSGLCILGKFRQIERKQTMLIRQLAIEQAERLDHSEK